MGVLEQVESHQRVTLGERCLLGRHAGCELRLEDPRISGEHASVRWVAGHWELRDLGSRNGTFVGGRRLTAGERVVLSEGDSFSLGGGKASFRLVEASSPAVRVRQVGMDTVRTAEGGLLVLPDDENPLASLFLDAQGRWVCELGEEQCPVRDQEMLRIGETDWVVELPAAVETVDDGLRALDSIHLRIGVSRDEEHVRMVVVSRGQEHELPTRSHHYLLATLARVWLSEHDVPENERGWVDRERLCRMLATDTNKLNVDIHRARRQFSTLGIREAANLVERRPGTGQMRLGVRSVEVFKL